jgi:hypothetical protein
MGSLGDLFYRGVRNYLQRELGRQAYNQFGPQIQAILNSVTGGGHELEHHVGEITGDGGRLEHYNPHATASRDIVHSDDNNPVVQEIIRKVSTYSRDYLRNRIQNRKRPAKLDLKKPEQKRVKLQEKKEETREVEKQDPKTMADKDEPEQEDMETGESRMASSTSEGGGGGGAAGMTLGREKIHLTPMSDGNASTFTITNRIPVVFTNNKSAKNWEKGEAHTLRDNIKGANLDSSGKKYYEFNYDTGFHMIPDRDMTMYINENQMNQYFQFASSIKFNNCGWKIVDLGFYSRKWDEKDLAFYMVPAINQQLQYIWDDNELTASGYLQKYNDGTWEPVSYGNNFGLSEGLNDPYRFNDVPWTIPKWMASIMQPCDTTQQDLYDANPAESGFIIKDSTTGGNDPQPITVIDELPMFMKQPQMHKYMSMVNGSEAEGHLKRHYDLNTPWLALNQPDNNAWYGSVSGQSVASKETLLSRNGYFCDNGRELSITALMNMRDSYSSVPEPQNGGRNITQKTRDMGNLLFRAKPLPNPMASVDNTPIYVMGYIETHISVSVAYDEKYGFTQSRYLAPKKWHKKNAVITWQANNYVNPRGRANRRRLHNNWRVEIPKTGLNWNCLQGSGGDDGSVANKYIAYGIIPRRNTTNNINYDQMPNAHSHLQFQQNNFMSDPPTVTLRSGKTYPKEVDEENKRRKK